MLPKNFLRMGMAAVGVGIVGYFLYHTVEGERGWIAQNRLQNAKESAQSKLEALTEEREALERRVQLIRPEKIDPDLLEEEARKALNFSKPNEIVILTPTDKNTEESKK